MGFFLNGLGISNFRGLTGPGDKASGSLCWANLNLHMGLGLD